MPHGFPPPPIPHTDRRVPGIAVPGLARGAAARILCLGLGPEGLESVRGLLDQDHLACTCLPAEGAGALEASLQAPWAQDLILVRDAPDLHAEEVLERVAAAAPGIPVVALLPAAEEGRAAACLRMGAADVLLPAAMARLAPVVRRTLADAARALALRTAQGSLDRTSALLRTALESTTEGLLLVDLAGRITAYNRKFLSLFGLPEYLMAPLDLEAVVQYLARHLGSGEALLEELRVLRSRSDQESAGILALDGGRRVETRGVPLRAGEETVGRVLAFREAPSKEPAADLLKAIGRGSQGFAEAVQASRVVPWYLVEDRLVVPPSFQDILGFPPPEDLRGLEEALHPDDAELFREALERGLNIGFDARFRRPGGAWARVRCTVDRGPEGHRGVFIDRAEPARLQERHLARQRAEGARHLARVLVGRLHDQVGTVLGDLHALGLGAAADSAMQGLQRIQALLARARSYALLGRPGPAPVAPNAFVADVLARAGRDAPFPAAFKPAPDLPEVRLDPAQMEQALAALLQNARQAQGDAGSVQVATSLLPGRPHRPGSRPGASRARIVFEVRDGGPGIPPAIQAQIFEPFFTTRLQAGSAGLGLTLAREIVEAHGGSLQVESAPGRGTAVRILLPV